MNYNLTTHGERRVFIIPITPIKKKKWWQFWKKDDTTESTDKIKQLLLPYHRIIINGNQKDFWFPSPNWGVSRKVKIEKIRSKINPNYHSLNE